MYWNKQNQDIDDCNTFFILMKISINAVSFYWSSDTPTFVTWRSSSQNQFVPKIVSPLPCSSELVHLKLLFVYFFKEAISFIGSLDKCHTSVFNALILLYELWTENDIVRILQISVEAVVIAGVTILYQYKWLVHELELVFFRNVKSQL